MRKLWWQLLGESEAQLRRLERAWRADPTDQVKRNRYTRALVRTGKYLDPHTSPQTGVLFRQRIRGTPFPAQRYSSVEGGYEDIPPEEITPTTPLGGPWRRPSPPQTEYSGAEYAGVLVDQIRRELTRVSIREYPSFTGRGPTRPPRALGTTTTSITGTYRVGSESYRVYADYAEQLRGHAKTERNWGFGNLLVGMEQGEMMPATRRRGRRSKRVWQCNAYAIINIEGPAYRLDSGQYRQSLSGTDYGRWRGVRRSLHPVGPLNVAQQQHLDRSPRKIHKFRNGKEVLELLRREIGRICSLEVRPVIGHGTPEWSARELERRRLSSAHLELTRRLIRPDVKESLWEHLVEMSDEDVRRAERRVYSDPSTENYQQLARLLIRRGKPTEANQVEIEQHQWENQLVTRANVESLHYRQTLYHITDENADGSALRARVNGRVKLWKTRPREFRLPMKHGLRNYFYITHDNTEWSLVVPS